VSVDVSIVVVAHESAEDLARSLPAALAQSGISVEMLVVDNASRDGSASVAQAAGARVLRLPENRGFAGGANAGIVESRGRYVATLNPDCVLSENYCEILARRLDSPDAADVGSATGKLLRADGRGLSPTATLDSTGIVFTASGRHFDRYCGRPDSSAPPEGEVAGASGAAAFYRRAALDSVRISTGWLDEDFFLYREDADLALRLRRAGWRCLYVPAAVAFHRRGGRPEAGRRAAGKIANYHSVKNRFLLRVNNSPVKEFRTIPTIARDAAVLAGCLAFEHSSLPAFSWLWHNRTRLLAKRREIRARSR
jgi:GT2 family glycosyltransferase